MPRPHTRTTNRRRSLYIAASFACTSCLVLGIAAAAHLAPAALAAPPAAAAAAAPAASPQALVDAAYAAMGGASLKTVTLLATLAQFDPGESYSLAEPAQPGLGTSQLTLSRDLVHGLARLEWVRPKADDGGTRTFTEIVTPAAGYVIGNDAVTGRLPKRSVQASAPVSTDVQPEHTMSGRRLTATLRELERPVIVAEMKQHPAGVSAIADQTIDGKLYPAAQYRDARGTFIIIFDPASSLPLRVRSRDWDALEGDSDFDAQYSDWRDARSAGPGAGAAAAAPPAKLPYHTTYLLNGMKVADLEVSSVTANPALPPAAFAIPPRLLAAAAKPAPANITPFQWIIRRQFTGYYFDSDAMYTDDGDALTLVDVASNISQTQGGTHNTLFIATDKYLVAVEAPNDDGQSIKSIALAKKRYPGKPIRYLILTHHHVDHVGGMRTYAAEGATIVVGKGDGDYFRTVLARPETLNWNAPKTHFTPKVIEVDGKWADADGGREVDAYAIDNPHAADMLIVYAPDVSLGIVTDLYTPGSAIPSNEDVLALVKGVEKWGIHPAGFAGGHGTQGPYAALVRAAQKLDPSIESPAP